MFRRIGLSSCLARSLTIRLNLVNVLPMGCIRVCRTNCCRSEIIWAIASSVVLLPMSENWRSSWFLPSTISPVNSMSLFKRSTFTRMVSFLIWPPFFSDLVIGALAVEEGSLGAVSSSGFCSSLIFSTSGGSVSSSVSGLISDSGSEIISTVSPS